MDLRLRSPAHTDRRHRTPASEATSDRGGRLVALGEAKGGRHAARSMRAGLQWRRVIDAPYHYYDAQSVGPTHDNSPWHGVPPS